MKVVWNDGLLLPRKSEPKETIETAKIRVHKDQDFKNILGLQIMTSMLAISTIYFYSDKEYTFSEASSVVASCWKPGMLESGHFLSVFTGHWAALWEVPGSPLHQIIMAREIGNIVVLPVEVFNDTDSFSFLMWVKCGGQWWFLL